MYKKMFIIILNLVLLMSLSTAIYADEFEGRIVSRVISVDLQEAGDEYGSADGVKQKAIAKELMMKTSSELKKLVLGSADAKAPEDGPYTEMEFEVWIKGKKMSMEMEHQGQKSGFIIDLETRDMLIIQWEQKMVMKMNLDKMAQSMPNMMEMAQQMQQDKPKEKADQFSLKATGKKEKINGYACALYEGTGGDGGPMIAWMSKDLADELRSTFIEMSEALSKINPEDAADAETKFFMKEKSIPIVRKNVYEDQLTIDELIKIEKMAVPPEKFAIPEGFQEMDMMKMMQGMGF